MSKKSKSAQDDLFGDYDSAFDPVLGSKESSYVRCYESHPAIEFKNATGKLYGGSCHTPKIKTADVYVGLDYQMGFQRKHFPWEQEKAGPIEFQFKITDQAAPNDEKQFVAMIGWLKLQLIEGKNVHVGCFGGHGRTGLVLAALVKEIDGIEDAITHVRKVYCKKAVESKVQVKFLNQRFGITEVEPSKKHTDWAGSGSSLSGGTVSGVRRAGPPSSGKLPTHSGSWGDYIPGTSISRARGPRELATTKPKAASQDKPGEPVVIYGLPNSTNSVW